MFITLPSPLGCDPVGANWLPCARRPFTRLNCPWYTNVWQEAKVAYKAGSAHEDPTPNFDVSRFVNEGVADRLGTICKNRSFIKEKGFHHPDDFFRKTIMAKGWRALCQPPHPAAMSVV